MKKNLTRLLTVAFCLTQASISLCPPPAGGPPPAPLLNLTEFSKLSQQEKDEWKRLSRDQQVAELGRFKAIIAAKSAGGSASTSTTPSGGKTSPTTPPSTSGAGGGGGGGAAATPRATAVPVAPNPNAANLTITGPGGVIDLYNELHPATGSPEAARRCQILADLKALLEAVLAGQPRSYIPIFMNILFGYSSPATIQADIDTNCTGAGGTTSGATASGTTGSAKPAPSTGGAGAGASSSAGRLRNSITELKAVTVVEKVQSDLIKSKLYPEALNVTLDTIEKENLQGDALRLAQEEIKAINNLLLLISNAKGPTAGFTGIKAVGDIKNNCHLGAYFGLPCTGQDADGHLIQLQPKIFEAAQQIYEEKTSVGSAAGGGKTNPLVEAINNLNKATKKTEATLRGANLTVEFLLITLNQIRKANLEGDQLKNAIQEINRLTKLVSNTMFITALRRNEDNTDLRAYFGWPYIAVTGDWDDDGDGDGEAKPLVELRPELFQPAQAAYQAAKTAETTRKAAEAEAAADADKASTERKRLEEEARKRKEREEEEARQRATEGGGAGRIQDSPDFQTLAAGTKTGWPMTKINQWLEDLTNKAEKPAIAQNTNYTSAKVLAGQIQNENLKTAIQTLLRMKFNKD